MFNIIEKVLSYFVILNAIQNHSSNRIESEIEDVVVENDIRTRKIIELKFLKLTLHSSCLVSCNHFESLFRSRSFKTLSIRMRVRSVVVSFLIFCSSRTIHNKKIRFLLISWKIWFFESQMIQLACWKWFNKLKTRSRTWIKNTMNNAIWSMNFKMKEKFYKKK